MRFFYVVLTFLMMTGCGGGGGGGTSSPTPVEPVVNPGRISGYVAPIPVGATVKVMAANSSTPIAQVSVSDAGYFVADIEHASGNLTLQVSYSGLYESASGSNATAQGTMCANMAYTAGSITAANITPFSTLAYELVSRGNSIADANSKVQEWIGASIPATLPANAENSGFDSISNDAAYRFGAKVYALSYLSKALNTTANTNGLMLQMQADIRADGILDGKVASGTLNHGAAITGDTYRSAYSQALADYLAAVDDSSLTTLLAGAGDALRTTTASIVGEGTAVSQNGVALELQNPSAVRHDDIDLVITVTGNAARIATVDARIDGSVFAVTGGDTEYHILTDAQTLAAGTNTLEFVATLVDGSQVTLNQSFVATHGTAVITMASPSVWSGENYLLQISVEATGGEGVTRVTVNGVTANIVDGFYMVALTQFVSTLNVQAVLTSGIVASDTFSLTEDTAFPSLSLLDDGDYELPYMVGSNVVWQNFAPGLMNALAVTEGNSQTPAGSYTVQTLRNLHIPYLHFTASDDTGIDSVSVGYHSDLDQLDAVINLTAQADGSYLLPLTTDFMGSYWYSNHPDMAQTAVVKVTDLAGNVTTREYSFYTKSVSYELSAAGSLNLQTNLSGNVQIAVDGTILDAASITVLVDGSTAATIDPRAPSYVFNTANLSDGAHTIAIRVVTLAGRVLQDTVTITVDNSAPVFYILSSGMVDATHYGITGRVVDAHSGVYSLKMNNATQNFNTGTGEFSISKIVNIGHNTITLAATNGTGLVAYHTAEFDVTDNTTPVVSVYTPSASVPQYLWMNNGITDALYNWTMQTDRRLVIHHGNQTLDGVATTASAMGAAKIPYIMIQATHTDVFGVAQTPTVAYRFVVNNNLMASGSAVDAGNGYFLIPVTTDYLGEALIAVQPYDQVSIEVTATSAAKTTTQSLPLVLDIATPTITGVTLAGNYSAASGSATLNVATSRGLGATSVTVTVNGTTYTAGNALSPSVTFAVTGLPNGSNSGVARMYDRRGLAHTYNFTFNVDNTQPTMSVSAPYMSRHDYETITGTVADAQSGIRSLTVNGTAVTVNSNGTFTATVQTDPTKGLDGSYGSGIDHANYYTFVATDNAGNTKTQVAQIISNRATLWISEATSHIQVPKSSLCNGDIDTATLFTPDTYAEKVIVYSGNKTLAQAGASILDSNSMTTKSIRWLEFDVMDQIVREYHRADLYSVTYTYTRNGVTIYQDKPLAWVDRQNDYPKYRIALTEDYLGANFFAGSNGLNQTIIVKVTGPNGNAAEKGYQFDTCDFISLGIGPN